MDAAIRRASKKIGARLRALRTERGLTLEMAAERAGLHDKHVQRVETGETNMTIATLIALTRTYEVDLVELFIEKRAALPRTRLSR
ncbi:MAG: helix-turn-helix domain-containing protein [Polyangiaceae bacterium]